MENNKKVSDLEKNQESAEQEGMGGESLGQDETAGAGQDLAQALEAKGQELKTQEDKYLRLAAEFDNYKRLTQREQRESVRFANESLLKELLPILDNLERAIQSGKSPGTKDNQNGLLQGVELTLKQFLETIARFGVRPISSVGEPFDPASHQAVTRLESTTRPANTIVEEYQRGYRLHDRLLRAAMVAVAVTPEAQDVPDTSDANEDTDADSDTRLTN